MLRRFVAFVLTLCLCGHALAASGVGVALADAQEQAHAWLHFEGATHHHDDHDGGLHQDDSLASAVHVAVDAGQYAPALISVLVFEVMALAPSRPSLWALPVQPFPPLDGLERPPRRTA